VEKMVLTMPERGDHEVSLEMLTTLNEIASQDFSIATASTASNFSREDVSSWTVDNVCMAFLHLNYERFVTLHHRMNIIVLKAFSYGASATTGDEENGHPTTNSQLDSGRALDEARANILSSATRTVRLFEDLLARDLLQYSPSFL
jgi:hypothetical protein